MTPVFLSIPSFCSSFGISVIIPCLFDIESWPKNTTQKKTVFQSHLFTTNRVPYKVACIKLVSFKAVIRNNKLAQICYSTDTFKFCV